MSQHNTLAQPQPPPTPSRRWSPGRVRLAGYIVGVVFVAGLVALGFWLETVWNGEQSTSGASDGAGEVTLVETEQPVNWQRPVVSDAGLADRIGVRIVQLAVTAGGGLIDLRFEVVDPDKAAAVHDPASPPAIVDDATGLVVNQLLMGHSHSGPFKAGQTYYLIFENPGNIVQAGSTVSVLLGNAEVDHVAVR